MKHKNWIFSASVVTDEGKCMKPYPDPSQCHYQPHSGFVPLNLDPERSPEIVSLQVSPGVIFKLMK